MARIRTKIHTRYRPKLWSSTWKGSIEGWTTNFIHKNQWRCDSLHEFEDLLQDAYLIYLKVCERYPRVVNPRNFMGLYKVTITNWMHDHSRYMKRKRVIHENTSSDVSELYADRIGDLTHEGQIAASLAAAPQEVTKALFVLMNKPEQIRNNLKPENLNGRISRVLGVPPRQFDYVGGIREVLSA